MKKQTKNKLKLFDVFSLCVGTMISTGLFLIPGLAFATTGASALLAYLLASLIMIPSMLCKAELTSAMPKAGGSYFFLDRSFGPLIGTISGLGTFFSLVLKSAVSLVGFGAYLVVFFKIPLEISAIITSFVLMIINLTGAKESSYIQKIFVSSLLIILTLFIAEGFHQLPKELFQEISFKFTPFFPKQIDNFFASIGFVFVSYMGLTKVSSIAEEVENPHKTIPIAMIIALLVTTILYICIVFFIILFSDPLLLSYHLNPILLAAESFSWAFSNTVWKNILLVAALLSFLSAANAGIMAASRYPLAMSRDHVIPTAFRALNRFEIPYIAIFFTTATLILSILFFDIVKLAKLASTFHLFIFLLINISLVVMRESKISTYDPSFKIPLYPTIPLLGITLCTMIIFYMGTLSILFTIGLITLSILWFKYYTKGQIQRYGAIHHWFARLGKQQDNTIEKELWELMMDKQNSPSRHFNTLIAKSQFIYFKEKELNFETITEEVSKRFSAHLKTPEKILRQQFTSETTSLAPYIINDSVFPEIQLSYIKKPELIIVKTKYPISIKVYNKDKKKFEKKKVNAFFYLISPEANPRWHFRILARLADIVDQRDFSKKWEETKTISGLKSLLLLKQNVIEIELNENSAYSYLINQYVKDVLLPENVLLVLIIRNNTMIFPRGKTKLKKNDIVAMIGQEEKLSQFIEKISEDNLWSSNS